MIQLSLVSVGLIQESGSVILVLRAADLGRLLVMEVGLLEGRAIAMEAEGVRAPRPLTHDLMHSMLERFGAKVAEVLIRDYADKTFFATLVLQQANGERLEMDARPSDAVTLAIRAEAPIYVTEQVLEAAGMDETEDEDEEGEEEEPEEEDEDDEEDPDKSILH